MWDGGISSISDHDAPSRVGIGFAEQQAIMRDSAVPAIGAGHVRR
jgi:hypothetical protein